MYCGNCGKRTSEKKRYCEHCRFDLIHLQKLLNESDEDEPEERFRSASEVARRCLVLCSIVAASHDEDKAEIVAWLKREALWKDVSPKERSFLQAKKRGRKQLINASWRVEALHLLLWALQLVPSIDDSKTRVDPSFARKFLPFLGSTSGFIANSELRPQDAILDAKEKVYQDHWSVRDAEINRKALPQGIDPEVVLERHYAINWLMGYCGQAWDEITTDT